MKKALFGFFLVLAVALQFFSATAQPQNIHLSWNSNKKNATAKTMTLTWTTVTPNVAKVKYSTNADLAGPSKAAKAVSKFSEPAKVFVHKITIKNLHPGTTYYYQCGSDENGWSEIYSFKTGPKNGSDDKFVVGVWGDTQDNEFNTQFEKTAMIVDQLKKHPFQLSIHMGDIVDNGSKAESWKALFIITQPVNARAPFMPVAGNHDVNNDVKDVRFQKPFPVFYDLFNLPRNNTDYSFDYGNTHFVAISSGHAKGAEPEGNYLYAKDSPEYKWLEKDLAAARKNKNIQWIILYTHHPLHSFGWSHVKGWQERIAPLVDKYQVDLSLAGHRHVYERHKAMRQDADF